MLTQECSVGTPTTGLDDLTKQLQEVLAEFDVKFIRQIAA
jgi:hypothetical protein